MLVVGSLPDAAPVGHLPEGPAGAADLNLLRTDILLRDQRHRETVHRSARLRAGVHLVVTAPSSNLPGKTPGGGFRSDGGLFGFYCLSYR